MVRWCWMVLAGIAVASPLGVLLSFLGALPFMLGLFFYALFGLVVGAVMFRGGAADRPLPSARLRVASAIVVLTTCALAIELEARGFTGDRARFAVEQVPALPAGTTRLQAVAEAEHFLKDYLRTHHPPGGVLGYIQWELFGERIGVPMAGKRVAVRPEHWRWALRMLASVVLLTFGVHSQVGGLAKSDALLTASELVDSPGAGPGNGSGAVVTPQQNAFEPP